MLKKPGDKPGVRQSAHRSPTVLKDQVLDGLAGGSITQEARQDEAESRSGDHPVARSSSVASSSDVRFKTDIEALPDALRRITSLNGVSYDWRRREFPDQDFPEGRVVGVLAQEVERVLPEAVVTQADGFKCVHYAYLIPLLIEAMKELDAQNRELRDMIQDQPAKRHH